LADRDPLEALIGDLPVHAAPTGWKQRVLSAIDAGTPPAALRTRPQTWSRWRIAGGSALAVAAALAAFVVIDRETPPAVAPSIAMQVRPAHAGARSGAMPEVGDTVVITVRGAQSLRVYRDGARTAGCPGDAGCVVTKAGVSFTRQLTGSGAISAVAYATPLPDPAGWHASSSDLDLDLAFATGRQIPTAVASTLDVH
jgi:hypothetical protein